MTVETMTSKQRVLAALRGHPVDRIPTGALAVHFCAAQAGVSLKDFTLNASVLADCVLRYNEQYSPDAVWVSADTWVTAEAMGAQVVFHSPDQPCCGAGNPVVRTAADIDRIPTPDQRRRGRQPLMLEATQRVVEAIGDDVAVVACFDQYPFSLACALMGLNEVMLNLVDDAPMVEALMERCLEHGIAYAQELAACGADILSGGDSPAGLIGPALYRTLVLPFEKRLVSALHDSVSQPVSLHICGDATPILTDMAESQADILELDHEVDISDACRVLGPEVAIWGNLDPVSTLTRGTPESVKTSTRQLIAAFLRSGHHRFVVSSGCTLTTETPPGNLRAMSEAARTFAPNSPY